MSNYKNLADEQLIEQLRRGQQDIMEYLIDKYKYVVRKKAKAMYLLGGDNDDLIQEGMIGLFKAVRDFDPEKNDNFSRFAQMCIVRQMCSAIKASRRQKHMPLNQYISLYESDEKEVPLIDVLGLPLDNSPEEILIGKEHQDFMGAKLRESLSKMEQEVLDLYLEGNDYKDIAAHLSKTPKSIDNTIQRIKAKAEKLFGGE